jgi:hypothetical protein
MIDAVVNISGGGDDGITRLYGVDVIAHQKRNVTGYIYIDLVVAVNVGVVRRRGIYTNLRSTVG